MTQPPLSRAQRRQLQRDLAKTMTDQDIEKSRTHPQWPLAMVVLGLFFSTALFSIVQGTHAWHGPGVWPKIVGWSACLGVGALSFYQWTRKRSTFRWGKRWLLLLPAAFFSAVALALIVYTAVQMWQENLKLDDTQQQNSALVQTTSSWTPGTRWTQQMCKDTANKQQDYIRQLRAYDRMPLIGETLLLFGTEQTRYQAGCDPQWDKLIPQMIAPNPAWEHASASQWRNYTRFVQLQRPNQQQGCWMEVARAAHLQDERLTDGLKLVCEQAPKTYDWIPDQNTHNIQRIIKIAEERNAQQK